MKILGIETSCDETAAAIVKDGKTILSSVVASSTEMHRKYGGIVPEVAARKQVESMVPILTEAMNGFVKDDIDAIAVTVGPGLIGSLLVGVETAKTLALTWNKPIIPVNHVLAHMYANFISSKQQKNHELQTMNHEPIFFPAISLVVSGGHTEIFLMTDAKTLKWLGGTSDDAAGEAFDKAARLLGFENRGGAAIETAALRHSGERSDSRIDSGQARMTLPRPLMHDKTLNFSFSGLKTAILREFNKLETAKQLNSEIINYFSHEVQEAITDVLVSKTLNAAKMYGAKSILVSGGVAANKRLKEKFMVHSSQFVVRIPPIELCTDNAASIASYAFYQNNSLPWQEITAQPNLSVEIT